MSKSLLTPIQAALAIQVSESSIKRWCDKGIIPTEYTAGGHRRIPVAGLLAFLRAQSLKLVHPEMLGFPSIREGSPRTPDDVVMLFAETLLEGEWQLSRKIILELYLRDYDIPTLADRVISPAMAHIGTLWEAHGAEVYQERRACDICLRILHELASLVVEPPETAPLALGGSPEGDAYVLPTTLVELVLRDAQWRALSLGNNIPLASFAAAIRDCQPRMVWLSISHLEETPRFIHEFDRLYEEFGHDVLFVIGGRGLHCDVRSQLRFGAFCENLAQLARLSGTLRCQSEQCDG